MSGYAVNLDVIGADGEKTSLRAWRAAGPGTFDFDVSGESHHQEHLRAIVPSLPLDAVDRAVELAILLPEADNSHDANAVAVIIGGDIVGRLARDAAEWLREDLAELNDATGEACVCVVCEATFTGGYAKSDGSMAMIGVLLDLELPLV